MLTERHHSSRHGRIRVQKGWISSEPPPAPTPGEGWHRWVDHWQSWCHCSWSGLAVHNVRTRHTMSEILLYNIKLCGFTAAGGSTARQRQKTMWIVGGQSWKDRFQRNFAYQCTIRLNSCIKIITVVVSRARLFCFLVVILTTSLVQKKTVKKAKKSNFHGFAFFKTIKWPWNRNFGTFASFSFPTPWHSTKFHHWSSHTTSQLLTFHPREDISRLKLSSPSYHLKQKSKIPCGIL